MQKNGPSDTDVDEIMRILEKIKDLDEWSEAVADLPGDVVLEILDRMLPDRSRPEFRMASGVVPDGDGR